MTRSPIDRATFEAMRAPPLNRSYREIGRHFGMTKNAVSGWASRNGYSKPENCPLNPRNSAPKPAEAKPMALEANPDRRVKIKTPWRDGSKTRFRACQWIEGEPSASEDCKCLAEAMPGKPYCAPHWSKSHVKHVPKPRLSWCQNRT